MTRDELIAQLQQHRDNDVRVYVPREDDRGAFVLEISGVSYDNGDYECGDFIAIDTDVLTESAPPAAAPETIDAAYALIERHFQAIKKLRSHIDAAFTEQEKNVRKAMFGASDITAAEEKVAHYLASRLTASEIAREIHLSTNTVKTHMKNIYRKLGVNSRNAAIQAMSARREMAA